MGHHVMEAVTTLGLTPLESIHPVVINDRRLVFGFCQDCSRLVYIKVINDCSNYWAPFSKGRVRAAGVVCLIGLGLSLGTLLLYKLYLRIIVPFLDSLRTSRGSNSWLDDDYTLYLDSESEVDKMGNASSKRSPLPSVYYSPFSGVTLGSPTSRPDSSATCISDDDGAIPLETARQEVGGVRLRPRPTASTRHKSPSPGSDKDSAIGAGGSEMSQSLYSENSVNRDSFYSTCTAESGFDDLGFLEELRGSKLSGSLKENFSPNSLKERSLQMMYRAHRGRDPGLNTLAAQNGLDNLSDCSSEHSGIISSRSTRSSCCSSDGTYVGRTNVDPFEQKLYGNSFDRPVSSSDKPGIAFSTPSSKRAGSSSRQQQQRCSPFSSSKSSPHRPTSSLLSESQQQQNQQQQRVPSSQTPQAYHNHGDHHLLGEDHSSVASGSIRSFNSSEEEEDEEFCWVDRDKREEGVEGRSGREGEEDDEYEAADSATNLPPHLNQSLSDLKFRQSLMQRIQEWSSFAEEYNKSMSPTPESSPIRFVRRSRSLDRHIGDASVLATEAEIPSSKPIEIEPVTEKNLETLEFELHDIQGEFESITSRLHDLIEQGNADTPNPPPPPQPSLPPLAQASMSSSYPAALSKKSTTTTTLLPPSTPLSALTAGLQPIVSESTPTSPRHPFLSSAATPASSRHAPLKKMKTKWEKVPAGSACSDTSRSSRGSSVEYVWDLADYSPNNNSGTVGHAQAKLASTDLCPVDASDCVVNISSTVSVLEYCRKEWKGDTAKARAITQGYHQVSSNYHCDRLCIVRGDNYCALRSTLFQVLVNGHRIEPSAWGIIGIMDRLHDHFDDPSVRMSAWSFANRLPDHCKDKLASISKCALSLYATVEEVCNLATRHEREKRMVSLLNTSATFDVELMEGLKVMMVLQLVVLRQRMLDGEDVPVFVHLLFARDTSENVCDFVKNHLNCVGDSAGLDQVEMCLLGYTLGVRLRVLRLAHSGQQDFDCCFPDDTADPDTPSVLLLAEDDRHYNVPLP